MIHNVPEEVDVHAWALCPACGHHLRQVDALPRDVHLAVANNFGKKSTTVTLGACPECKIGLQWTVALAVRVDLLDQLPERNSCRQRRPPSTRGAVSYWGS